MTGKPARVAAIDIGSNSIRGIVAEVAPDGSFRIIDDERFQTRLGAGLVPGGEIGADRIEASVTALEHLLLVARSRGAEIVRAVATAAIRSAANGPAFIETVRSRLGLTVEVIDGETEAHFAYLSAAANFTLPDPVCIVDIGGGSLEIVFVQRGQVTDVFSLPLGAVRLLGELPADEDPPSAGALKALTRSVRESLRVALEDEVPTLATVIGSGGTITSLAGVAAAQRGEDPFSLQGTEVSAAEIGDIVARLSAMKSRARGRVPGLAAYRADTAVPGGIVIRELVRLLGAERLLANQRGLREGILLDTIARLGRDGIPESLKASALGFAERCHFDASHADHVTRHALALFDALAPDRPALRPRDRELLEAAAIMHDVGYLLGHEKHNRHSWHLIIHAGLPGLTARENAIVAALARYHRGSSPKPTHDAWTRIADGDRERTLLLAGILRVADGLDRSQAGDVRRVEIGRQGDSWRITAHGVGDLAVDIYGASAKSDLLASALGAPVEVVAAR